VKELVGFGMVEKTVDDFQKLEESVRKVQLGDIEQFAEVVRLVERPVRAWIVSRCPPGGDADDVAQKAFIEAFKKIDNYEVGTNFRSWMFTIAKFQLMAECTRLQRTADYHSRYAPVALTKELERQVETESDFQLDRMSFLQSCLAEVDRKGHQLLQWRYADEFSIQEIARLSGRSTGAIKKNLYMLRQKLHECIRLKQSQEAMP